MFSALVSFSNLFRNNGLAGRESVSSSVNAPQVKDEETVCLRKDFSGTITHVFGSHGLVDGEVYFSYDTILGKRKPCQGDQVMVSASRQHKDGGWYAEQVAIETNWDDNDGDYCHEDGDLKNLRPSIGTITKFQDEKGLINDEIDFTLNNCVEGFSPLEGDWVTADITVTDLGSMAVDIQPLRQKQILGEVTAVVRDHGFINKDVFFRVSDCKSGYNPRRKDAINCTIIESTQRRCSWRAISVSPVSKRENHLMVGSGYSNFLSNLLQDKDGIAISGNSDFGEVYTGKSKSLTIWIRNIGVNPQTFLSCQLPPDIDQFSVSGVKLARENMLRSNLGKNEEIKGKITLYPTVSAYVNVTCNARHLGHHKELLVFKFENFKIGKYVTTTVVDPYHVNLEIAPSLEKRSAFSRYKESAENPGWIVPGEKAHRLKIFMLPNRLPQYTVPAELRTAIIEHQDITEVYKEIAEELCYENYSQKFSGLLHLEEIQREIEIRQFDLERVCLRTVGEYLALMVPWLAEGRPSVLVNDKVYLSDPGDVKAPVYEGYIHEVLNEEVLLKFNPGFHQIYSGEDYNVRFSFNRTPIRRCHHAAEFSVTLGRNVLFPSVIESKFLQYHPASDPARLGPSQTTVQFFNRQLNEQQKVAITKILQGHCRPLPYILFGPPGTGKTITIVETILQIFTKLPGSRAIACTPSNSAADLLAERLHKSGVLKVSDMVRLNAFQRNLEDVAECIRPYCSFGDNLDISARYRILICTCVSAGLLYSLGLKAGHFTHAFIDEAGQATEPESMIALSLVSGADSQIVLAGDPMQLGPVLRSSLAKKYGLELSFLERLTLSSLYARDELQFTNYGNYNPKLVTKLINNYRSHPALLQLPSQLFYHQELSVQAKKQLTHSLCGWKMLPNKTVPLVFHGVRGDDLREGNSPSFFNPMEAVQVVKYLQALFEEETFSLTDQDIGIITPYKKQVEKIRLLIDKLDINSVKVGSVEEFQGQEKKVIIISTVRSNEDLMDFDLRHTLGFLSNPKRFNVSITRAQALLIIVGNPHVLMHDLHWLSLLKYCVENKAYTGCHLPSLDVAS